MATEAADNVETVYGTDDGAADAGTTDTGSSDSGTTEGGDADDGAGARKEGDSLLGDKGSSDDGGDAGSKEAGNDDDGDASKDDGEESGAPESYADFTLPEGVTADTVALETATPLFKELNLTQEQAQKLVDFEAGRVQDMVKAQDQAFFDKTKEWAEDAAKDRDIGGDKFEENVLTARLALDKLGSPALVEILDQTGMSNHPAMVKFAFNVGKLLKEDNPGASGSQSTPKKSTADIMYD